MSVLVDSSVWIAYFRGDTGAEALEYLIEEDLVVINDLILAELLPLLILKKEHELVSLLREVKRQPMAIHWDEIVHLQTVALRNGINGIGIPDLIILQNAVQGSLRLLSKDKHFDLLSKYTALKMFV